LILALWSPDFVLNDYEGGMAFSMNFDPNIAIQKFGIDKRKVIHVT